MVRSKAVHFFQKKNENIFFEIICYCICFTISKKLKKSCDARFFRSKAVHRFFFDFLKKVKKMGKSAFFPLFFLWSQRHFHIIRLIEYHAKREKKVTKKKHKKNGFRFLKLFFKNENWTFIFVHLLI